MEMCLIQGWVFTRTLINRAIFLRPSPSWRLFLFAAFLTFLTPRWSDRYRILIINQPLAISTSQTNPPRLAFNELTSQRESDFSSESKTIYDLNEILIEVQKIKPIEVTSNSGSSDIKIRPLVFSADEIATYQSDRQWTNELRPVQKHRLEVADSRYGILDQDWSEPSPQEIYQEKINEALAETGQTPKSEQEKSGWLIQGQGENGQILSRKDTVVTPPPPDAEVGFAKKYKTMRGKVRLVDGVYLGDRAIEVHHFVGGVPLEPANVDVKEGTFNLRVENPTGAVVAQMFDHEGRVIASGQQRLTENTENLEIELRATGTVAGLISDFGKTGSLIPSGAQLQSTKSVKSHLLLASLQMEMDTDELGSYETKDHLVKGRSILRAEAKSTYPMISTVKSGLKNNLSTISASTVKALAEIVFTHSEEDIKQWNGSLVWGQVTLDGKPISGARVMLESSDNTAATYFKEWLPDFEATETSENGYFAFVNLPPGLHSVVAKMGDQVIGHANFVSDEEAFSPVPITATIRKEVASLRVFDAFSGQGRPAQVSLQSQTEDLTVDGYTEIYNSNQPTFSLAKVDAGREYVPASYIYSEDEDHIHLPLITSA